MNKIAFITCINGQDGSYLSELLLSKDYYVYGMIRRMSCINTKRVDHLYNNTKFKIYYGDMTDTLGPFTLKFKTDLPLLMDINMDNVLFGV